ncbi:MAG: hypothetical protein M1461_09635 [Nitrospirae bacterium]|nr:hypothetical protein [Nitrospirota bacterium]MCL5422710.1 hypothetical protein [Nitrospirota bacterium]
MSILTLSPSVTEILKQLGSSPEEKATAFLITGIKEYLKECELEILEYETKYGFSFDEFKAKITSGEIADEFSYEIEGDAMKWEDLMVEKRNWLDIIKKIETLIK